MAARHGVHRICVEPAGRDRRTSGASLPPHRHLWTVGPCGACGGVTSAACEARLERCGGRCRPARRRTCLCAACADCARPSARSAPAAHPRGAAQYRPAGQAQTGVRRAQLPQARSDDRRTTAHAAPHPVARSGHPRLYRGRSMGARAARNTAGAEGRAADGRRRA